MIHVLHIIAINGNSARLTVLSDTIEGIIRIWLAVTCVITAHLPNDFNYLERHNMSIASDRFVQVIAVVRADLCSHNKKHNCRYVSRGCLLVWVDAHLERRVYSTVNLGKR